MCIVGIGQAIAEALAKSGADIALLDLDEDRQEETKAICRRLGVKARAYACNVLDIESCKRTFASIEEDLGPVE
jgi:NAD(P)-dependent dehydrogenase (short-subunit alcohol dehydrogenase family)